ncbi:glycosyltransferase family 4 protein [Pedobacter alluvionis]|uniref:Glycosyltransferase n=1 Tax=Pedobacter alluvionis TaxID=475253 RepID=A0A497XVZ1_9SPHI|nr:glycosyltransferase family 4 protein [Pedobacter alluvionis]RLJ73923.1 glycosyltransferase involved in cell wall biosynthesis [Pedobacter alluvionis]TFB32471.1 glycosyltransferase [Pedobacter alluvionis]
MKDIIFINSHPIQYFAPMYKYMNDHGVKTKAWYESDESIKGGLDIEFGTRIKWDIPLLEGYEHKFFKNHSWKPSHKKGFFGLINLGLIKELFQIPKSIIVVHGWHYFTHFLVLLIGGLKGHEICIRCDIPLKQEKLKKGVKQKIKFFFYKYFLFPRINWFLYIGEQNRLFYKSYGIKDHKLLFCPYAVDNDRFVQSKLQIEKSGKSFKQKLQIPENDRVILFSGKYIDKKLPLDLINSFSLLNDAHTWLVMIGEGALRPAMEKRIAELELKNVVLTGFINQSEIVDYYSIGDVFVMCSALGENWGLSVNEAMNFNMPLIISDLTGCSEDLVVNGKNGYTFETRNINDLAAKLKLVIAEVNAGIKCHSLDIVENYSYASILVQLSKLIGVKS